MRRTRLNRWGKKGPWLLRYRQKVREQILREGRLRPKLPPRGPAEVGARFPCLAAMLGDCGGPMGRDHIFNKQVKGVGGCDCKANVPGHMCWNHHRRKHDIGRDTFYRQHPDLEILLDVARKHYDLRQRGELPCSPKWCRHRGTGE